MTKTDKESGCWPTLHQELLLQATLKQGKESIDAWKKWQSNVDVDKLDVGSYRLLPLLYRNLQAQGIKHPLMGRFKGVYRQTWYKNQILFHKMANLLRDFHQAGINKNLLLKGTALILFHYKDYGLRPMDDFDVLIPIEQTVKAILLLKKWHWISPLYSLDNLTQKQISALMYGMHAWEFKDNTDCKLDLHWHVLQHCLTNEANNDFWTGAVHTHLVDVPVYALNPTDQLLHVCVHGIDWNPLPPLRWVADAMMIFKTAEIDWERLLILAEQHRSVLLLKETLNYLRHQMDAPIPSTVLTELQNKPVSKTQSFQYHVVTNPRSFINALLRVWFKCQYKLSNTGYVGWWHVIIGFVNYLRQAWNLNYSRQLSFYNVWKSELFNHK